MRLFKHYFFDFSKRILVNFDLNCVGPYLGSNVDFLFFNVDLKANLYSNDDRPHYSIVDLKLDKRFSQFQIRPFFSVS